MNNKRISRTCIVLGLALCAAISALHKDTGNVLVTTWDVYGYYVYLPGAVTYGDLDQFAFAEDHFSRYEISSGMYQLTAVDDGRVPIYTAGLAMVWSPFYLLAEGMAWISPWERDGLSPPYQWAIILAALTIAALGFWCLHKVLLRYFDDVVVALVLSGVLFGTNYFHYLCFEPGMPHTYLFAGHAILLYCVDSWFSAKKAKYAVLGALCLTLMCLIRPTEVIALILPVGYVLFNRDRLPRMTVFARQAMYALGLGIVVVLPQVLFWRAHTGDWVFNAYAEAGHVFHFDGRHVVDGLFSYRKGWLLYTPLMVFALVGLASMKKQALRWKWPLIILVAVYVWLTFSWHMWFYASSFGSRPMIHVYPELSLGLAAAITWMFSRRWTQGVTIALLFLFVLLNLFQTWQYHHGVLPKDNTTSEIYWSIFGKTELDRARLISIDLPDRLPGKAQYTAVPLAQWHVQAPSDLVDSAQFDIIHGMPCQVVAPGDNYSDALTLELDGASARRLSGAWVDNRGMLYSSGTGFDQDRVARMVLDVTRGSENLAWHAVRFQIFTEPRQWQEVVWEYRLPQKLRAGDVIKLIIWNQSPDTIGVGQLELSLLSRSN